MWGQGTFTKILSIFIVNLPKSNKQYEFENILLFMRAITYPWNKDKLNDDVIRTEMKATYFNYLCVWICFYFRDESGHAATFEKALFNVLSFRNSIISCLIKAKTIISMESVKFFCNNRFSFGSYGNLSSFKFLKLWFKLE